MEPPGRDRPGDRAERAVAGRYVLESVLGRGGMGTVWRARDTLLERDVAVKEVVVPASADDPDSLRARVLREARAAARLSHPNVVRVYDVVDAGDRIHLVMELVGTPTLAEVVRRDGPLPPGRAAAIGLEVLAALEAAAAEGIVHRDVKPGNVMVGEDAVKLADFGIASVHDDPSLTASGTVLGSPSYMSPEQARGETSGAASDRWALGATLYYAVEGVGPFDRDGGALPTLNAVVHDEPRPPVRAGALAPVLAALLAKDPTSRPGHRELREELARVAAGGAPSDVAAADPTLGDTAGGAAVGGPPATRPRSRRGAVAAAAAVLLVLAGLAVAAALRGDPPADQVAGEAGEAPSAAAPAQESPAATPTDPLPEEPAGGAAEPVAPPIGDAGQGAPAEDADEGDDGDGGGDGGDEGDGGQGDAEDGDEDGAGGGGGTVPADWQPYTDPATGYEIAHPPDWEVVPVEGSETLTDFRDPASPRYLRVDWAEDPVNPPTAAWETMSASFASRYADYEEIRLEPTTYQGYDAAIWEYRYTSGGSRLHGLDLGIAGEERGYALNYVTTEDDWEAAQPQFEAFKDAFVIPE